MKRIADPCRPASRKHRAAQAWMAARGITQPRPLYPIVQRPAPALEFRPVARKLALQR
jgi:hypothetical protein